MILRAAAFFLCCCFAATVRAEPRPPSIVRIAGHAAGSGGELGAPIRQALGCIVEADGFVLTNYRNLIDPATGRLLPYFRVTTAAEPDRVFSAEVIGVEPTIDIGILKIDGAPPLAASADARALPITTGMKLRAATHFAGGDVTFVDGDVTGLNTRQCYQESLSSTMFRAHIALGPEALGGPVFLAETGAVVALYTGYHPPAAPGHVEDPAERHLLPISLCFNIYESLKQRRSLRSPWTGFSVRPLTAKEEQYFPTTKRHNGGVGIEYIWPDSPAARLGVRVDDVLVQFGYNRITSVADFQKWLYLNGVGQPVKLIFLRGGVEYLTADYTIEERPASAQPR